MYSMNIIWVWFLKNTSTNLFIHISSCFKPLPRLQLMLIQVVPNPVKSSLILWVLSPKYHNIHRLTNHGNFNTGNLFSYLIKNLLIDSSPHFKKENNVFYKKTFFNLVFGNDFAFTRIR